MFSCTDTNIPFYVTDNLPDLLPGYTEINFISKPSNHILISSKGWVLFISASQRFFGSFTNILLSSLINKLYNLLKLHVFYYIFVWELFDYNFLKLHWMENQRLGIFWPPGDSTYWEPRSWCLNEDFCLH